MVVVVGGHGWSILPQIGRWWVRGRFVVAMGHTSACGVVVANVGGAHGPWSVVVSKGRDVAAYHVHAEGESAVETTLAARPPIHTKSST